MVKLKLDAQCIPCILNHAYRIADKYIKDEEKKILYLKDLMRFIINTPLTKASPYITAYSYRLLKSYINVEENFDFYKEERMYFNKTLLNLVKDLEEIIKNSKDRLLTAVKIAAAGNIIDFGAFVNIEKDVMEKVIKPTLKKEFPMDVYDKFKKDLKSSKYLLYLGDNSGEVVLDMLLIKEIKNYNPDLQIIFATRGGYVLNDVTKEDAYMVGIDKFAIIIDNGTDIPGTDLEEVSEEFMNWFRKADIIISKGQGNFETLGDVHGHNIYFIFLCKCDLIMKKTNLKSLDIAFLNVE
ncbi:damage-control phosphatase ARMT1 family protein [Caldanaerobacter sp.]|uniref:damage-control phosphatase ARMT1 family protein n=1 Tax=Caldanaerobacter sp. TaxID=2930036 RepID=UPI003C749B57